MSYNSKYKGSEVDALLDKVNTLEIPDISGLATKEELHVKVDKVDGKQLSTEDFTTLLKTKLDGLSNYDDAQISQAVESLQTQLNTLVGGNASTAIESFNEIIAFLEGIEDSESLDSIIASIEQQIAAKQDKIDDLQTIREGAALGATAIQEHQSLEGYAKTADIPTKVSELENDSDYATPIYGRYYNHKFIEFPFLDIMGVKSDLTLNTSAGNTKITFPIEIDISYNKYGGITDISESTVSTYDRKINEATHERAGFMTAEDKVKLDGLTEGGAYPLVNHGTDDTTFTLTPNTFHVWTEVTSLDLTLGEETDGIVNEFVFQFVSGATATTLTLPDTIMWANGEAPSIEANKGYQVSIVNNIGLFISVGGNMIEFFIDGTAYQADEGMTWEEWVDSGYNTGGYCIHYGFVSHPSLEYWIQQTLDTGESVYVSPPDAIIQNCEYYLRNDPA